LFIA